MVNKTTSYYILDVWKKTWPFEDVWIKKCTIDTTLGKPCLSWKMPNWQRLTFLLFTPNRERTSLPEFSFVTTWASPLCPVWRRLLIIASCHLVCSLSIWIDVYMDRDDHFIFTVLYKSIWVQTCIKCVRFMTLFRNVFFPS